MSPVSEKIIFVIFACLAMAGTAHAGNNATESTTVVGSGMMAASPAPEPIMGSPMNSSPDVIHDRQTIRSCLCLENQYKAQQADLASRQATYNQAMSEKASLDAQISAAKAAPLTPELTATIRSKSEQQIESLGRLNRDTIPALQTATTTYNDTIDQFQQSCGGKSYDSDVLARVRQNLTCQ